MKTVITKKDIDWVDAKNACRNTVNKDATPNQPSEDFKLNLLLSEHSPVRLLRFRWKWYGIKSWVATHFARHWLGWDKFISTQRTDRTGVNRDELPQGETVVYDGQANAQAGINVGRVRLCYMASPETREAFEDLKVKVTIDVDDNIGHVFVPNCVYRGGCPEFPNGKGDYGCGWYTKFVQRHPDVNMNDIRTRYQAYNDEFYTRVYNERAGSQDE